jgi:hypothetical protein
VNPKVWLICIPWMLFVVAACNAVRYKEPVASGSTARVRFATDSRMPAVLRVYDDPSCLTGEDEWLRVETSHPIRSQPKRLGIPLWTYSDSSAKEFVVTTEKPFYAMFVGYTIGFGYTEFCGVPIRGNFDRGHDYEFFFNWSPDMCNVTFSEIIDGDPPHKVTDGFFTNKADATNSACLLAFKKRRWN